jgi:hypothetical protein
MNYIDHHVRQTLLQAPGASLALTTGTEMPLYPLTNLYNGRPGIPFRSEDVNLVIDLDVGATPVKAVYLLATNLENIGGAAINLKACNAFPPVTDRGNGSPFSALDTISDFYGTVFLYPVVWTFAATCTYFRFTISQPDRVADYIQIGEIWIEKSGDHTWFDDSDFAELFPSREQWSGRQNPIIEHEREARARAFLRGQGSELRADTAGAATLWERAYRSLPLVMIDPAGYAGQRRSLRLQEDYADSNWRASEFGESVIKSFDGDGKI